MPYNIMDAVEKIALFLERNKKVSLTKQEKMTIHGHILPLLTKGAPMSEEKKEEKVEHEDKVDQGEAAAETAETEKKSEDSSEGSDTPPAE